MVAAAGRAKPPKPPKPGQSLALRCGVLFENLPDSAVADAQKVGDVTVVVTAFRKFFRVLGDFPQLIVFLPTQLFELVSCRKRRLFRFATDGEFDLGGLCIVGQFGKKSKGVFEFVFNLIKATCLDDDTRVLIELAYPPAGVTFDSRGKTVHRYFSPICL